MGMHLQLTPKLSPKYSSCLPAPVPLRASLRLCLLQIQLRSLEERWALQWWIRVKRGRQTVYGALKIALPVIAHLHASWSACFCYATCRHAVSRKRTDSVVSSISSHVHSADLCRRRVRVSRVRVRVRAVIDRYAM